MAGADGLAGPFVILPDLVFPRTFSCSTTAGAYLTHKSATRRAHCGREELTDVGVLRLLAVFAFGFGAATFLVAGAFLGSATLAEAFFVAAAFFLEAAGLTAVSFCKIILSDCCTLGKLDHTNLGGNWLLLGSSCRLCDTVLLHRLFLCELNSSRWTYSHVSKNPKIHILITKSRRYGTNSNMIKRTSR